MDCSKNVLRAKNNSVDEYFVRLNSLRKSGRYCDVTMLVDGKEFTCHRAVLASASCYFNAMFGGQFEESDQKRITLNEVSERTFESLLEFVYCHKIAISDENSYELLCMSEFFDLGELKELCVRYMETRLPCERILETCTFAKRIGEMKLYESAVAYVAENLVDFAMEEVFLEVPYEVLDAVISHPRLQRVDDVVLDLIVRWKYCNTVREPELRKLLSCINTGGVSSDYLVKFVPKNDEGKRLNVRVMNTIDSKGVFEQFVYRSDDVWIRKYREYTKNKIFEKNTMVRGRKFTLSCFSEMDMKYKRVCFNSEFKVKELLGDYKILKRPPVILSKQQYELTNVQNVIYLYRRTERNLPLYAYYADLNKWFAVQAEPRFRATNSCVATMNNLIYLIGGQRTEWYCRFGANGWGQFYDSRTKEWTRLPNMSQNHSHGAACSLDGKLYVLGGESKVFERYDPKAGKWEVLKSPLYNRPIFPSLVSYAGKLWVIGCTVGVPMETYDFGTNSWMETEGLLGTDNFGCWNIIDAFVI